MLRRACLLWFAAAVVISSSCFYDWDDGPASSSGDAGNAGGGSGGGGNGGGVTGGCVDCQAWVGTCVQQMSCPPQQALCSGHAAPANALLQCMCNACDCGPPCNKPPNPNCDECMFNAGNSVCSNDLQQCQSL
jgi:hypothetical protein